MVSCTLRRWIGGAAVLLALAAAPGCGEAYAPAGAEPPDDTPTAASRFNPATAGTLRGRVRWQGPLPVVPPFTVRPNLLAGDVFRVQHLRPNPNTPRIDARTRGVADAVVFLRGVDPRQAKPWNHPPVCVEQQGCAFHVRQGTIDSPVGFVRQGDAIAMVSYDPVFHALHAGGAAFFTLTFPDPGQPLCRRLRECGRVELTSAAGYYWMHAYLFVDEHPYSTRTDAAGRFTLTGVPPGRYQLVCWLPNWNPARHTRDPESGMISRLFFREPIERQETVALGPAEVREVGFQLSAP